MSGSVDVAYRAAIFHLSGDPAREKEEDCVHYHPDGVLAVKDGLIASCGPAATSPHAAGAIALDGLIVPGFVDAHVHYPQLGVMASPNAQLLDWLESYTFPHEARFANPAYAAAEAEVFLDAMLRAGTTTALVFATTHQASAAALFAAAARRRLRLATGKVLSDVNLPAALRDTPALAQRESQELIDAWHGKDRLAYAVTPRFAATSSKEQLQAAGELLARNPGVLLHTHLSENENEIAAVAKLHAYADGYLDAYARAGLLTARSVFAHAIHLEDGEWDAIAGAGAKLVHCPCSNLFFGCGLFDAARAARLGIDVALGSDVGGGTSLLMLRSMEDAFKAARLRQDRMDPLRLWHLATRGGAKALGWEDRIGSLLPGYEADFVLLRPQNHPVLAHRLALAKELTEKLFAIAVLGDASIVAATYVLGELAAGGGLEKGKEAG